LSVQEILAEYSARLFGQHDFAAFGEIAAKEIVGNGAAAAASDLEAVLQMVVKGLVANPSSAGQESAARALDAYIADVWPIRRDAGLDMGGAAKLVADIGVRRIVQPETNFALRNAERAADGAPSVAVTFAAAPRSSAPAATQAEQKEEADEKATEAKQAAETAASAKPAPTPAPAAVKAKPKAKRANAQQFGNRPVSHDELCNILIKRRDKGRIRAVILGLATAGKTFFVQRLARNLGGNYSLLDYWENSPLGGSVTGRTQGIIYYELRSNHPAYPSIDLFDVPGEAFRGLATGRSAEEEGGEGGSPVLPSLYAVLAATDVVIFIEPAFEVLAPDQYRRDGDDAVPYDREDFRKQIRDREPTISQAELDERVEEQLFQMRDEHMNLSENFHNNFEVVRARTARLRASLRPLMDQGKMGEFKAAIDSFAKLDANSPSTQHHPLPIPGLYLLSKADEYFKRAAGGDVDFDRDPSLTLAEYARDRFKVYSRGFELFGVDFITSQPRTDEDAPMRIFSDEEGSAGFQDLITHWIRPAVRLTRPPHRLAFWKYGHRWARAPETALKARLLLDRSFRQSWRRKGGGA